MYFFSRGGWKGRMSQLHPVVAATSVYALSTNKELFPVSEFLEAATKESQTLVMRGFSFSPGWRGPLQVVGGSRVWGGCRGIGGG